MRLCLALEETDKFSSKVELPFCISTSSEQECLNMFACFFPIIGILNFKYLPIRYIAILIYFSVSICNSLMICDVENFFSHTYLVSVGFPGGSDGKESTCKQETWVQSLGWKDHMEK